MPLALDDEMKGWMATNLMLGRTPESIAEILLQRDYPKEHIEQELAALQAHPALQAGQRLGAKLERRESLLKTLDAQQRMHPEYLKIEKVELPPFQQFLDEYYSQNRLGFFKNAAAHWPALQWTPRKLMEKVGSDTEVEVQFNRDSDPFYESNSHLHRRTMPFGEFIDMVESTESSNNFYMTATNMVLANNPAFRCVAEDMGDLGDGWLNVARAGQDTFLWIGPKGTITPLHHDLTNNLFLQVYGRKKFHLIPALQVPYMYNELHVFSDVELMNLDEARYPDFKQTRIIELEVEPGDLLFIPIGWWHHVIGLTANISLSFTHFNLPFNGFLNFPKSLGGRY